MIKLHTRNIYIAYLLYVIIIILRLLEKILDLNINVLYWWNIKE